nr:immunoglobulin heavy chain junction region [Mus musculus]
YVFLCETNLLLRILCY